ncbi:MAG: hypothetical protein A4E73_00370 [Syntrophaceae bacterium PtaU1.Bin231]|nr:MAG: hypothetical protein A4E73_00370 [Syntrophaceae bacterium PtaU1.Bin231]
MKPVAFLTVGLELSHREVSVKSSVIRLMSRSGTAPTYSYQVPTSPPPVWLEHTSTMSPAATVTSAAPFSVV